MTLNIQKTQFQKFPYWSFLTCQDHGGRGRNQGSDWYPAELDQGYGDPWMGPLFHPWRCLPSGNLIFVQGIVFFNIVALEKQVFPFCLNSTRTWLLIINIQLNGWPGSPRTIRKTQQQWRLHIILTSQKRRRTDSWFGVCTILLNRNCWDCCCIIC